MGTGQGFFRGGSPSLASIAALTSHANFPVSPVSLSVV